MSIVCSVSDIKSLHYRRFDCSSIYVSVTWGDSCNKGCFGRKTNLFRESGDFAGNRETWEIFREI